MPNPPPPPRTVSAPYGEDEIRRRLDACPKLASLNSINHALGRLVKAEEFENAEIAALIRRDPSLSARLLRMVNSVFFGLSSSVNDIDEAVFFLGLRRLRELSMATPVIEELERLQSSRIPAQKWKELWAHSVGTAVLCRETLASTSFVVDGDTDYLVGLLHNVGKIVMAYSFPEELMTVAGTPMNTPFEVCALERELIGWDHAQIGAYFLERHQLAKELVSAVRYHHEPERAPSDNHLPAGVQVADALARHAGLPGGFELVEPVAIDAWTELAGWKILHGENADSPHVRESAAEVLLRLPALLKSIL